MSRDFFCSQNEHPCGAISPRGSDVDETFGPVESFVLGLTCHLWRNRLFLLWLLVAVPVVTAAAVRLMDAPSDLRPEVMR